MGSYITTAQASSPFHYSATIERAVQKVPCYQAESSRSSKKRISSREKSRRRTIVRHMDVQRLQRPRQHTPLHAPEGQVIHSALQVHSWACAQHARACCVNKVVRGLRAEGAELHSAKLKIISACCYIIASDSPVRPVGLFLTLLGKAKRCAQHFYDSFAY